MFRSPFGVGYHFFALLKSSPGRGQLSRENESFPLSAFAPMRIWSRETRGFDSSVPRQLARISILSVNLVLSYGIPPDSMQEAI